MTVEYKGTQARDVDEIRQPNIERPEPQRANMDRGVTQRNTKKENNALSSFIQSWLLSSLLVVGPIVACSGSIREVGIRRRGS